MSEHSEQCAFVEWLEWNRVKFYAVPNGGKRNAREAKSLKDEGVRKGVPDVCIPVPVGGKHGLYIEMKYGKNKPTEEQKEWLAYLSGVGYSCAVCYSASAAIKVTREYLNESEK